MSFAIQLEISDAASPVLNGLASSLEDGTSLHASIAGEAEGLTSEHILEASESRHKTADRLGAKPTGYLEKAAEGVSSAADAEAAFVILNGNVAGFARAFGDVEVRPRKAKNLAIPAKAAAYGKRPGEFDDLELLTFKSESSFSMALGRPAEEEGGKADVFFWLVKKVTLPQDRGLLPSDDQYLASAELGAIAYLNSLT